MDGVEHVFERMVHDHQDRLYALGYALTGNRHDAEEVAQDTLLRAYRALVRYPPERVRDLKQRAWLHRIAVNVARNRYRRPGPRMVELNGTGQDAAPGPETRALQRLEMDGVAAALACLPERYREAGGLRCVPDLSYAEAGEGLGPAIRTGQAHVPPGLRILRS